MIDDEAAKLGSSAIGHRKQEKVDKSSVVLSSIHHPVKLVLFLILLLSFQLTFLRQGKKKKKKKKENELCLE
ncbi:hypothetical protein FEM48_Zijuj12G0146400 [Ziziphus jujuba var. spinosa]|uniref:Uncharacterized protein n=1 Tax=Ziziphus jujuba var. spinosa TaxID=714518 RepID=A0A978UDX3_ZIZJJ|nr:hypothetical protein FEM48_Zijuj12G0146400 [Ziziphus jujuba var. spinosa]